MRVPRNIAEAYKLDQENGNSLWTEAIDREVKLLRDEFECFRVGKEKVREVGMKFRQTVLSLGGRVLPSEVFKSFRGRDPSPMLCWFRVKKTN